MTLRKVSSAAFSSAAFVAAGAGEAAGVLVCMVGVEPPLHAVRQTPINRKIVAIFTPAIISRLRLVGAVCHRPGAIERLYSGDFLCNLFWLSAPAWRGWLLHVNWATPITRNDCIEI